MTVKRQYFYPTLPATTLAQGMDASQTSAIISSASGWTVASVYPFLITIDRDGANEERCYVNGRSGTTLTGLERGADGSTGIPHTATETVEHTLSGQFLSDVADLLDVGAAGQVLQSSGQDFAWGFAPIPKYATTTARGTSITAPVEGDMALITGEDRLTVYDGTRWMPLHWYSANGRAGVRLTRAAAQTVLTGANDSIIWTAEVLDLDGWWASGTDITVPAGHGGWYHVKFKTVSSNATGSQAVGLFINGVQQGSTIADMTVAWSSGSSVANVTRAGQQFICELAAGDVVTLRITQSSGANRDYSSNVVDITRFSL